jgi:hypothetical protein
MDRLTARVLIFLSIRVFVNSIRRAFENPLRAALTILVASLILCGWGGALLGSLLEVGRSPRMPSPMLDPEQVLTRSLAIVTGFHLFYTLLAFVPAFSQARLSYFVEADVNYLFPTPLRGLSLFRGMLLARGAIGSLFLMLMMVLYLFMTGGRSIRQLMLVGEPKVSAWALLIYPLMLMLMLLGVLWLGVALRLVEAHRPRIRWWVWAGFIGWMLGGVGLVSWRTWMLWQQGERSVSAALQASLDWLPAYLWLLPVRALSDAALIVYQGWTPAMGLGLLFWVGVWLWADRRIARDAARLYELAAQMAQRGAQQRLAQTDPVRTMYQSALERMGQRDRPVRTLRWLERWTPRGVWALLWRDLLLAWRLHGWGLVFMLSLLVALPAVPLAIIRYFVAEVSIDVAKMVYAAMQFFVALMTTIGSYYGIVDLLRRVDFQKPLPFSSRAVVLVEALPTAVLFLWVQLMGSLVASLLFPQGWSFWLGMGLAIASFAPVLQMAMWTLALLNPDPHDYTQRLVLSFVMLPVILLAGLPGGLILGVGLVMELSPLLLAPLVIVANLSVGAILVAINSRLYEQFNPVD